MLRYCASAVVLVYIAWSVSGDPGDPSQGDWEYEVRAKAQRQYHLGDDHFAPRATLLHFRKEKGEPYDGYYFSVECSYLVQHFQGIGLSRPKKNPWRATALIYPPLERDELIPLVGRVYRVKQNDEVHKFEWVPKAKLPDGLEVPFVESLFVTIERGGAGFLAFPEGKLRCPKIVPGKGGKDPKDGPSAELVYEGLVPKNKPGVKAELSLGTIHVNDVVVLPNADAFVVRHIVPPDPKGKILGWVELSGRALEDDEIEKTKLRVVRLEPVKK